MDDGLEEVAYYRYCTKCPEDEPWNLPLGKVMWMSVLMGRIPRLREGYVF